LRSGRGDIEEQRQHVDGLYKTFAALPSERFPLITVYAAQMAGGDADERFRFAIDVVIDGVLARSSYLRRLIRAICGRFRWGTESSYELGAVIP
jgi:hypothetical protein